MIPASCLTWHMLSWVGQVLRPNVLKGVLECMRGSEIDNLCVQVVASLEAQCGRLGSDAVRRELGDAMDPNFSVLFLLAPHVPDGALQSLDPIDFLA